MRTLTAFFIALLMMMVSSQAFAMQPRKYSDDDKEFFKSIYDSCKQAVTANLSEKDFQKTICYAHFKGIKEAAEELSMRIGLTIWGYTESCKELGEAFDMIKNEVCPPQNLTPQQFAQDYVTFVDSKDYMPYHHSAIISDGTSETTENKPPAVNKYYMSPAELYITIYACDRNRDAQQPNAK